MAGSRRVAAVAGIVLAVAVALAAGTAGGHPPEENAHGVDENIFGTFWSRDEGDTVDRNASTATFLGETTDVSYLRPPSAQKDWNRGELAELGAAFDRGERNDDDTHSIYPRDADRTNGTWIKDAYADVFAIQPSTVAHVERGSTVRAVPTAGTVLAAVDFRVELQPSGPPCRWRNLNYQVVETRLLTGSGDLVTNGPGRQVANISYSSLPTSTESIVLEADLKVFAIDKGSSCGASLPRDEELTVNDSVPVSVFDLPNQSAFAEYPDGGAGVFVLERPSPWGLAGLSLPDGAAVHSPFRYFSARRPAWDAPRWGSNGTAVDTDVLHVHPLRIHAYPSRRGVRATEGDGDRPEVRDVVGVRRSPPEMPANVSVDVVNESYTLPYGYDIWYNDSEVGEVATNPIHGGPAEPITSVSSGKRIRRSELTLRTVTANATHVRVDVQLHEADTGDPIDTNATRGSVVLQDRTRVNTTAEGNVTVTIDRPTGAVRAEYEPAPWWNADRPFDGDRASLLVTARDESPSLPDTVVRFLAFVSPFLAIVYMLDRAFDLDVWPPWREL